MNGRFEEALVHVRQRRAALRRSISVLQDRVTPARLSDEVLRRLDPEFSVLHRIARRVLGNKLLTLVIMAGAGWLAGGPRRGDGEAPAARKAGTETPQANPKEKKNDSGHHQHRKQREDVRPQRRRQGRPPKGGAQAQRFAQQHGKTQPRYIFAQQRGQHPQHVAGPQGLAAVRRVCNHWQHAALQPWRHRVAGVVQWAAGS